MKLKRYSVFSVVYITLIALYIYSFEGGLYRLDILHTPIELPIAIWIIIPLVILYFLSLFHMFFNDFKRAKAIKRYQSDLDSISTIIKSKVLGDNSIYINLKTEEAKGVFKLLEAVNLSILNSNLSSKDEELVEFLSKLRDVESGEYVKDLKVKEDSDFYIKNLKNRLNSDSSFAIEVLNNQANYEDSIIRDAYLELIQNSKTQTEFLKYIDSENFTKELAFEIFKRYGYADIDLTIDEIKDIISKSDFEAKDFISLANMLKSDFEPNKVLAIFESLANRFDKAEESYIYVLLDFEMIDKAKEILDLSSDKDFQKLKAYLYLKESGEQFNIELFA